MEFTQFDCDFLFVVMLLLPVMFGISIWCAIKFSGNHRKNNDNK